MNPLADPQPLIRRVYAYVAYRLGDGPDAEDVTSGVFERALRYRQSYDGRRGAPIAWLMGIARRCVDDALAARSYAAAHDLPDLPGQTDLADEVVRRLTLAAAVAHLQERDRELIALRYGADLTARQIAELLELKTHAVEVALQRALARLRAELGEDAQTTRPAAGREAETAPVRIQPVTAVLGLKASNPAPQEGGTKA